MNRIFLSNRTILSYAYYVKTHVQIRNARNVHWSTCWKSNQTDEVDTRTSEVIKLVWD